MNKRGCFPIEVLGVIVAVGSIIALPFMTPRFRKQKAMAMCEEGGTPKWECERIIGEMTPGEILSYIRDW